VLSYNIHECIGTDDRQDVDRIAEVLRAADPDLIGLQEVQSRFEEAPAEDHLDRLAAALGMQAISGPTLFRAGADYGNALLCRHPVEAVRRLDLSFPGREPAAQLLCQLRLALRVEQFLKLGIGVEVIFDGPLRSASDEDQPRGSRRQGLFDRILDQWFVDHRQHFLGACLGGRQKARTAAGHRENRSPDLARIWHPLHHAAATP
jgi:hypothetical protein